MYLHRHDERAGLALWLFQGARDEDWEAHFAHLRQIAEWPKPGGRRVAAILVTKDFDRPDAKRRAELARLTDMPGYDPYVAFVSPNVAVRAMLTMFSWVQKAPRYEMDFFSSTQQALSWLEIKRGSKLALETMIRELRLEYAKIGGDLG